MLKTQGEVRLSQVHEEVEVGRAEALKGKLGLPLRVGDYECVSRERAHSVKVVATHFHGELLPCQQPDLRDYEYVSE